MQILRCSPRRMRLFAASCFAVIAALLALPSPASAGSLARPTRGITAALAAAPASPNFGSNVYIFTPDMAQSAIQATVDAIAAQQVSNQFGTQRYALLFEPGTYGSSSNPLNFQVGYYTTVAGLGLSPTDVVINGSVYVRNQCFGSNNCIALDNFWRSLSNLTINVTTPGFGCYSGEFWAVSQAAPMRRVQINGLVTLMDYCSGPSYASGGFIADSQFNGSTVINGSQQQFFVRNSQLDGWTNGVWNQVFSGVIGAPAQCFPASSCGGPYTTLATSPVTREAPYLYLDTNGNYNVFVPAVQTNSSGTTWASGPTPGYSIPIGNFYVAQSTDTAATINNALHSGKNLILTPGVYPLTQSIQVTRPDTIVLGLGLPTLIPNNGIVPMTVASAEGMSISGLIIDAGATNSPVLMQVGDGHARSDNEASDPSALHDVFFRIGGAQLGKATTSLVVNSNNVILDDIWAWRADHGNGVGWTDNTADTGLVVNGNNATAYGLFVEHYQKYEVIWNGNGGTDIFFQNEMPYDPPSQAAWMEAPGVDGWAAFNVADNVTSFNGYGMGSYSFFNQGVPIYAANAFEVPTTLPAASMNDLLTIFLSTAGSGGILNVIDNTGGSSTIANPDTPVTVVSYP
ncbi:MAG TPA: coagulation factor 5/8 type domain-containing protein [Candidatus Sulfotelmatobacter sp.]|nr:coagulation factor 5/8 type domain-containing protein [Candidatus Sulfotelmatobacter sp.]